MDIIVLGHGSRRGNETDIGLQEVVRRLQYRFNNGTRVRLAGFEFTRPALKEAIVGLAEEGARSIVIFPFFLFEGKHIKIEIPEQLGDLKFLVPGVQLLYAHPLGVDPRLMQIVFEKVQVAAGSEEKKSRGIVLVVRGSQPRYDPGENLCRLAAGLEDIYRGKVPVNPAQAQFGLPTIENAISSIIKREVEEIIVVPYLLFPGKVLYDNIIPAVDRAREMYPHVSFVLTPTLGVDDRMIDITLDRLREVGVEC